MAEALTVRGLGAGYHGRRILADIDLTLARGEVMALLGANGSGKSTLVRAITGQIQPQAGRVVIGGVDLAADGKGAKAAFGLAIDAPDLPDALTGDEYLALVADIRGTDRDSWPCGDLPARLMLTPWLDRGIADYSLGTRAKIAIAAAMLGGPQLLIFDESLNGLDPVAAWEFKQIVRELALSGRHAILVATHVVEAVPAFCTRALLLSDGRIVASWDEPQLAAAKHQPAQFEEAAIAALRTRQGVMAATS